MGSSEGEVPSRKTKASAAVLKRKLKPLITASEQEKRRVLAEEQKQPPQPSDHGFTQLKAQSREAVVKTFKGGTNVSMWVVFRLFFPVLRPIDGCLLFSVGAGFSNRVRTHRA